MVRIATMTRSDLWFVAHKLAKYSDNPGSAYRKAESKVYNYVIANAGVKSSIGSMAMPTRYQEGEGRKGDESGALL